MRVAFNPKRSADGSVFFCFRTDEERKRLDCLRKGEKGERERERERGEEEGSL